MMKKEIFVPEEFEYVARWVVKRDKIKPDSLRWNDSSGWVYAFVKGKKVMYIGLTGGVLRSRLDGYSYITDPYSKSGQTDRLRGLIRGCIESSKDVYICGLRIEDQEEIKACEDRLIVKYDPPWNIQKPVI